MFLHTKWPHWLLLLPKLKSDSGSGFSQIFDSGPERKTKNPAGVDSDTPDPDPLLISASDPAELFYEIQSGRVPVLNCKIRLNCDPKTGSCSTLPRDRNQRSGLKPILVDQDKIGLQFLLKIGGSGLIRSEKFVLIKCDYSTHMKIFRLCLLCCQRQKICWGCSGIRTVSSLVQIYWRVRGTSSTVNLAEKEVYPYVYSWCASGRQFDCQHWCFAFASRDDIFLRVLFM